VLLKTAHIPDDVWGEVMGVRDQIVGGSLKVEPVWDAEAVRALMNSVEIGEE
jgi:simple sugar transport system substrate-binding protein